MVGAPANRTGPGGLDVFGIFVKPCLWIKIRDLAFVLDRIRRQFGAWRES